MGTMPQRGQFVSTVEANQPLCREHYRLILHARAFPQTHPGQFVQLACRDTQTTYSPETEFTWEPGKPLPVAGRELMSPLALLRRPFSLAAQRRTGDDSELHIVYRVVGTGTRWIEQLKKGDRVDLIGPLGNHFDPPAPNGAAILVGGGVGIPPMLYLAERLAGRRMVAFVGAMSRDLLPLTVTADAPAPTPGSIEPLYNIDEFARHGAPAIITTNDGSYGFHGLVTDALALYLDRFFAEPAARAATVIYTCGPEGMMKRVAEIAAARNIECQVSVERAMACGMGTCQSCCIRVRKPDPSVPPLAGSPWAYRLACTDGPIFRGADLLW